MHRPVFVRRQSALVSFRRRLNTLPLGSLKVSHHASVSSYIVLDHNYAVTTSFFIEPAHVFLDYSRISVDSVVLDMNIGLDLVSDTNTVSLRGLMTG
jgi:hypothetical protein